MRVVVDTGATAPLSVSKSSSMRIKKCSVPTAAFSICTDGGQRRTHLFIVYLRKR